MPATASNSTPQTIACARLKDTHKKRRTAALQRRRQHGADADPVRPASQADRGPPCLRLISNRPTRSFSACNAAPTPKGNTPAAACTSPPLAERVTSGIIQHAFHHPPVMTLARTTDCGRRCQSPWAQSSVHVGHVCCHPERTSLEAPSRGRRSRRASSRWQGAAARAAVTARPCHHC